MIQSIKIKNLYYIYSYEINFANDENVLILTGPNGFGKTTLLQIINHLCSLKLWFFYLLPFDRIELRFEEGMVISINKPNKDSHGHGDVEFVMTDVMGEIVESGILETSLIKRMARQKLHNFRDFDEDKLDEYLGEYPEEELNDIFEKNTPRITVFLQTQKCAMIEEQRLIKKKNPRTNAEYTRTVEEIQKKISEFYTEAQKAYNSASLRIDGSFVKRLSDRKPTDKQSKKGSINKEQIYRQVIRKIAEYKKYGLVDNLEVVSDLGVHYNDVLKLYLADLYEKLMSIESYYKKLSTFDSIVSGKHLAYKQLVFKNDEMRVLSTDGEHEIDVCRLSSGEQNLLVLCYNLVFGLDKKDILLIDEPENSMHMAWLEHMLDDYIRIAKITGCQIIIATHSPAFIHGKWNLTYDLCEKGKIQES